MTKRTTVDKDTGEITVAPPTLRTRFNYDTDAVSRETGTECLDETLTQQHMKDECDINTIVERFGITGTVPTNVRQPLDIDFVEATDFHSAQNALIEAQQSFDAMPSAVREEFQNDPGKFIAFFQDEKNRERGEALGLINPRQKALTEPGQGGTQAPPPSGAPSDT